MSVFKVVDVPWTIKFELTTKSPFILASPVYVVKFTEIVPSPPISILLPFFTAPIKLEVAGGNLALLIVPSVI